jgi:hypothetical protein
MDVNGFFVAANNSFDNFSRKLIPWKNKPSAGLQTSETGIQVFQLILA